MSWTKCSYPKDIAGRYTFFHFKKILTLLGENLISLVIFWVSSLTIFITLIFLRCHKLPNSSINHGNGEKNSWFKLATSFCDSCSNLTIFNHWHRRTLALAAYCTEVKYLSCLVWNISLCEVYWSTRTTFERRQNGLDSKCIQLL